VTAAFWKSKGRPIRRATCTHLMASLDQLFEFRRLLYADYYQNGVPHYAPGRREAL